MQQFNNKTIKPAFSLIEILLVLATIGILAVVAIPLSRYFQVKNNLDIAVNTFVQTMRRSQTLSQNVDGDITWGVYIQNNSITLFKGGSYAGRDENFDENFGISPNITISGNQEIVFNKFSGESQTTGTTTLTTLNNESRDVVINNKGIIEY